MQKIVSCSVSPLMSICLGLVLRKKTWPMFVYINHQTAKYHSLTEGEKTWLRKTGKVFSGSCSYSFTIEAVVHETLLAKSAKMWKPIVEIDASQLKSYWVSQVMPIGFYRIKIFFQRPVEPLCDRWFWRNCHVFRNWTFILQNDQIAEVNASVKQAERRKMTASLLFGFGHTATRCLKH